MKIWLVIVATITVQTVICISSLCASKQLDRFKWNLKPRSLGWWCIIWIKSSHSEKLDHASLMVPKEPTVLLAIKYTRVNWTLESAVTFCVKGQPKNCRFCFFCTDFVTKASKTRNPEAELQGLVYFGKCKNCMINYPIWSNFQDRVEHLQYT